MRKLCFFFLITRTGGNNVLETFVEVTRIRKIIISTYYSIYRTHLLTFSVLGLPNKIDVTNEALTCWLSRALLKFRNIRIYLIFLIIKIELKNLLLSVIEISYIDYI
jgi:hypothetical protein